MSGDRDPDAVHRESWRSEALEFLFARATSDVSSSARWLQSEGFELTHVKGGPDEAFGNVALTFERPPLRVVVVQDKSQWSLDLGRDSRTHHMDIVQAAKAGTGPPARPLDFDAPLPRQLPRGVEWPRALPDLVAWLEHDHQAEIEAVWRAFTKRGLPEDGWFSPETEDASGFLAALREQAGSWPELARVEPAWSGVCLRAGVVIAYVDRSDERRHVVVETFRVDFKRGRVRASRVSPTAAADGSLFGPRVPDGAVPVELGGGDAGECARLAAVWLRDALER